MTDRTGPPPLPTDDPSVLAILDALAFTTAAIAGDVRRATITFTDALQERGEAFTDALISTVQLLADDAVEHGLDVTTALREVGLGVQLAHLAEHVDADADGFPGPTGPTGPAQPPGPSGPPEPPIDRS